MSEIASALWLNATGPDPTTRQYDLFTASEAPPSVEPAARARRTPPRDRRQMTDEALCASVAAVSLGDAAEVLGEVARRQLAAAIPQLACLIRRFKGFLTRGPIIEQTEALQALVAIGGSGAADVVRRAIEHGEFNCANLGAALRAAARLHIRLAPNVVELALGHDLAEIRIAACAFASARPNQLALLIDRLGDEDARVRTAAACALGELGRVEARSKLARLLQVSPSIAIIEAAVGVADEDLVVQLGKLARERDAFRDCIVEALEDCDLALATKIRRDLARSL